MPEEHPHRPDKPDDRVVAGQGAGSEPYQTQHSQHEPRRYESQRGYEPPRDYRGGGGPPREEPSTGQPMFTARRIAWGAVFAGVVIVLAVQILLNLLGVGIGAALMDPMAATDPAAWGIGVALWWVIVGLIALFLGGWVAGHLATNPDRRDGALHGLVTWGLATVLGVALLTNALAFMATGAMDVAFNGQAQQQVDTEDTAAIEQQAPEIADAALDITAQTAIWGFIALALGAVAAGLGGFLATPSDFGQPRRREYEREREGRR